MVATPLQLLSRVLPVVFSSSRRRYQAPRDNKGRRSYHVPLRQCRCVRWIQGLLRRLSSSRDSLLRRLSSCDSRLQRYSSR
ncbi:unnamed protein product [Arabidopsis halleri]